MTEEIKSCYKQLREKVNQHNENKPTLSKSQGDVAESTERRYLEVFEMLMKLENEIVSTETTRK